MTGGLKRLGHEELRKAFIAHRKFLRKEAGGVRLILKFTLMKSLDLSEMDFTDAILTGCNFENSRIQNTKFIKADLDGCIFDKVHAAGANFSNSSLRGTKFREADLTGVCFKAADFRHTAIARSHDKETWKLHNDNNGKLKIATDFSNSLLEKVNMSEINGEGAVFANCFLSGAKFDGANLRECDLSNSVLHEASFKGALLEGANLKNSLISKECFDALGGANSEIEEIRIMAKAQHEKTEDIIETMALKHQEWWDTKGRKGRHANFEDLDISHLKRFFGGMRLTALKANSCNANGVFFAQAQLQGASFKGADLRSANFIGCDLRGANFTGANLVGADFRGANLSVLGIREDLKRFADFSKADLENCKFAKANLIGAIFKDAKTKGAAFGGATI